MMVRRQVWQALHYQTVWRAHALKHDLSMGDLTFRRLSLSASSHRLVSLALNYNII